MPRTEEGLYDALEHELRRATTPLSCADLFDKASVRKHAATVNRVSDYLGNMWRKGQVVRLPAPRDENTRARWMYTWKGRPKTELPTMDQAVEYIDKHLIMQKANIEVSETADAVTIELPNFIITIKSR